MATMPLTISGPRKPAAAAPPLAAGWRKLRRQEARAAQPAPAAPTPAPLVAPPGLPPGLSAPSGLAAPSAPAPAGKPAAPALPPPGLSAPSSLAAPSGQNVTLSPVARGSSPSPNGLTVDPRTGLTGTGAGHAAWQNFAGGGLGINTRPVASWTGGVGRGPNLSGLPVQPEPGFVNRTQPDPNVQQYTRGFFDRYRDLLSTQNEPNTVDTQRLINQSNATIADQAAGAAQAGNIRAAQLGRGAEGGAFFADKVAERSGRAQNTNAATISLEQQRAQDARNDRRRSEANAFFLGGLGAATAPADLALRQQGLGLEQIRTQSGVNQAQNSQSNQDLAQFIAMANLFNQQPQQQRTPAGPVRYTSPYTPRPSSGGGGHTSLFRR
jgi:hypothetical protein